MGYDAACTLTIDGQTLRGTALLEHKDLIFRGPLRLVIPLSVISRAVATGGALDIRFGGRDATFDIGPQAARWAARITNPPSRLDKLGIKAGMQVAAIALADDEFLEEVEARGAAVTRRVPAASKPADVIFYGATKKDALERLAALSAAMKRDGALWVVRPKGQKAITEADTMAAGKRAGLVDVKVVSFSDSHSAEKFVIPVAKRGAAVPPARGSRTRESTSRRART
jgi:hypothetical protein